MKPFHKSVMESIQRGINSIRDGKDDNGRALSALRRFNYEIVKERDITWLQLAEQLICERLSKHALAGSPTAVGLIASITAAQDNLESYRAILLEYVTICDSFDTCFIAAGFGGTQDMFHSKEQGNVVEAIEQVGRL